MEAHPCWDEDVARRLVSTVAKTDVRMFSAYPDIGRDDLVQEGIIAAHAATLRTWDPDRGGTWENFVCGVAHRQFLDILRSRVRRRGREQRVAAQRPEASTTSPLVLHLAEFDQEKPNVEWLRDVYQAARRVYQGARWRRGRKYYNVAQLVAIAALKRRLEPRVSFREMHQMLLDDKELRLACRLRHVPSFQWMAKSMVHLEEFQRTTIDPLMGVPDPTLMNETPPPQKPPGGE